MKKYIFIIAILSIIIYANSIPGRFIKTDDTDMISVQRSGKSILSYRGLQEGVLDICYKIGGGNYRTFHINSIMFHTINSVLVFYFLLLFFKPEASFWGALIFASHPIHTEAVSWISGGNYVYVTTLLLVIFLLYQRKKLYIFSLVLFGIALTGNWTAVLFPGMIILYDFTYERLKKNWKRWLPFLLITLGYVLFRGGMINDRVALLQITANVRGFTNPITNMVFSIFRHLKLLLWPMRLSFYHDYIQITPALQTIEIVVLMVIVFISASIYKKAKPIFFAMGIYFLFLLPTYSPVLISWAIAERYLYIPSIGFCIVIAYLYDRYACKAKTVFIVSLVLLTAFYSIRTIYRNEDWRNEPALYLATVKASPRSPKAHNNLGGVYIRMGNIKKAIREFAIAVWLNPRYYDAYYNLGTTYKKVGDMERAVEYYLKAYQVNPQRKEAREALEGLRNNEKKRKKVDK